MRFDSHVVCVCVCVCVCVSVRAMSPSWHVVENFTNFREIYLKITQLEITL